MCRQILVELIITFHKNLFSHSRVSATCVWRDKAILIGALKRTRIRLNNNENLKEVPFGWTLRLLFVNFFHIRCIRTPAERLLKSLRRPSVCLHVTTRKKLNRFSWNWIMNILLKLFKTSQFWLKSDGNNGHFYVKTYMCLCLLKWLGGEYKVYPGYHGYYHYLG
jgi:hypothetical protein